MLCFIFIYDTIFNMNKILRIVFTIISALCLASAIPVGIFADLIPTLIILACAFLSFCLMLFFRKRQEAEELKKNPPAPKGDFFHPIGNSEKEKSEENEENEPREE